MKYLICFVILFVGLSLNAQELGKIPIDGNQDPNIQYIPISSNGKKLLSNRREKYGRYETKGYYKGVPFTTVVEAIRDYLEPITEAEVADIISDSLATISTELPYYELSLSYHHDAVGDSLVIDTIYYNTFPGTWSFDVDGSPTLGYELNCDCDPPMDWVGSLGSDQPFGPSQIQYGGFAQTPLIVSFYAVDVNKISIATWDMSGAQIVNDARYSNPRPLTIRYYHGN